ncbi:MAG: hypothetical protein AAF709_14010 [Pseudomonadota bacterium]
MDQQLLLRKFGRCDDELTARLKARAAAEGQTKLTAEIEAMPDHEYVKDQPTRLQARLSAIEKRLDAIEHHRSMTSSAAPESPSVEYRDNPKQAERIAALKAELEASRAPSQPPQPSLTFTSSFIAAERSDGEDDAATNRRLLLEYETLEAKRPGLTGAESARHQTLHDNFYDFRGS